MLLDDRPGQQQAKTHPFAFGRNKWLEQPVGDRWAIPAPLSR
jgi:hypothetical protein